MNDIRKIIGIKVINCPVCRKLIYPGDTFCYNCGNFVDPELGYVYEDEGAITMTENEAIKHLQSYAEVVDDMIKYCKDFEPKADITGYLEKKTVFAMAISAIKEIQQYHEISTVEEFRKLKERSSDNE